MRDERSAIVLRFFSVSSLSLSCYLVAILWFFFCSAVAPICWFGEFCYNVYIKVLLLKHLDTFGASESKLKLDAGRFFPSLHSGFAFNSILLLHDSTRFGTTTTTTTSPAIRFNV